MQYRWLFVFGLIFATDAIATPASTLKTEQIIHTQSDHTSAAAKADFVAVPFAFATESLSTAYGAAGVIKHAGQPQATALGIGLYTANDSWIGFLGLYNYQLPSAKQWLFSLETYQGHYAEGIYFLGPSESPSGEKEKIVAIGDEGRSQLHIKYVLPIGAGSKGAAASLAKHNGDTTWNPFESGVSSISVSPYTQYRELEYTTDLPDEAKGVEVKLEWDNRDLGSSSTQGGRTSLKFKHGLAHNGLPSWLTWEFQQSAFFSFEDNDWFQEQVLATNLFIADTPTWQHYDASTGEYRRPPSFAGVSLGGYDRQRGYTSKQFTGRSAVNYALEYRVKPQWQPLQHWPVFNLYDIPWWQWVVFAEAGNVADEMDLASLHKEMIYTYGAGIRFQVEGIVLRTDVAVSTEESQFWVMVNQPF